ncbi:MAG TPA: hypothetical protein VKT81_22460, partial [Bryobacteraceae bacterium]|nr:hypothetical protein [Bryobacteraceae bacterium]
LVVPHVSLPKLMGTLKGGTSRKTNLVLGRTGKHFWQDESYDHAVRDEDEMRRIRHYIEWNPVRAGLVNDPSGDSDDPDHHSDLMPISLPKEADRVFRSEATLGF